MDNVLQMLANEREALKQMLASGQTKDEIGRSIQSRIDYANQRLQPYDIEMAARAEAEQRQANLQKQFESLPQYQSALDFNEYKKLQEEAQGTGAIDVYERMREQANQGYNAEQQRLGQALQGEVQNVDVSGAGAMTNAYNQLAMGGGLQGGQRERVAASGMENQMAQRQQARLENQKKLFEASTGNQASLLNIGTKEADYRTNLRKDLAQQMIEENRRKQQFEQDRAAKGLEIQAGYAKSKDQLGVQ